MEAKGSPILALDYRNPDSDRSLERKAVSFTYNNGDRPS